jgi:amino acid transporter
MLSKIKNALIGTPLPTHQLAEKRLNKIRALAAFSPGALSSIAYANQEIYLGLVVAGAAGLGLALPIGLAITVLLVIVAMSYFQTIQGYPSGGGSYIVARENLGTLPGLFAGSALLIDYLLTAAVSLTAGVEAISSAFPGLYQYRIEIALFLLAIITVANLRGLRETGSVMAVPVYLFLLAYLPMLAYGVVQFLVHGSVPLQATAPPPTQPVTLFLVIHAFATGCTALTGIEAISNGVPAFKSPEAKNAGRTLIVMAVLMAVLFVISLGLTQLFGIISEPDETILSALTRHLLGSGPAYLFIQFSTMLILAVAANTSFAGFPQLAAFLAKDGFLPRQFTSLGDRLVFTNGIIALAVATGGLIVLFGGNSHSLIPLFAIGVFLAFTLSQAGMVRHWWHDRSKRYSWLTKASINAIGAIATLITLLIILISKFLNGAWITVLLIPFLVFVFHRIHLHYIAVGKQLSLRGLPPNLKPLPPLRLVVPVSGVHRGIVDAMAFAQSISKNITAVYIELQPGAGEQIRTEWKAWWPDVPLVVLSSPYRSIISPLLDYLDEDDLRHNDGTQAAVILPEFIPARWWQALLHNQTSILIRAALLYRRRIRGFQRIIIDVPYHLRK